MKKSTRSVLQKVNQRFYQRHGESFDATRQRPWPGWSALLEQIPRREGLRVLDAGCGNGRFAHFLLEGLARPSGEPPLFDYLGIDSERSLLEAASAGCRPDAGSARFQRSELGQWLELETEEFFDLVVLFGVLHHLPGEQQRLDALHALARRVAPGGLLAITWWMLHESPAIERKRIEWRDLSLRGAGLDDLDLEPSALDLQDLEDGDTLLSWKGDRHTPRYCHFPSERELGKSVQLPGLDLIDHYRSDGATGRDNLYRLYRRPASGHAAT
ncbi:MAG: class I SAM-dependent methyltransferase [Acidobacteriota bacterium]